MVLQEEEQRRLKEEQERKEHEEYLKLKESFVVEEEGETAEQEDEEVSGYNYLYYSTSISIYHICVSFCRQKLLGNSLNISRYVSKYGGFVTINCKLR